jgi:hypothetical protein
MGGLGLGFRLNPKYLEEENHQLIPPYGSIHSFMENLNIKKKKKLFMGFALGGELCWLGRMLLIFPFALHS